MIGLLIFGILTGIIIISVSASCLAFMIILENKGEWLA